MAGANVLRLIQIGFSDTEFDKNLATLSNQFAVSTNRRFKFYERSQLFIGVHNKAPSVAAVRVNDPDASRRASFPLAKPLCLRRPPWVAA